ncbi:phosphatidate cytidylyltransferase [Aeromicrobium sp. IC_218]|uniref:phosphatidate cytidylyltransferase n=1 Tax=Aeromicrobium sp. IC_218 TaxID=2545468 RepID=UPI00103DD446|nr:phosphatidate cytidylyltransferase [Aeromicrobium sp. IC_218]TCJ00291.1 phosphatidate cytidylyltransferase [Aeromicrobium sp. IC_218]
MRSEPTPVDPTEPEPAEPAEALKQSRAGRNLPAAIAVGVTLVALVVCSLVFWKAAFVGVVVVALTVGVTELSKALGTAGIRVPLVPIVVGGIAMNVGAYAEGVDVAAIAMALTVIGTFVWRMAEGADGFVRDTSAGLLCLSYVWLMGVFVLLMLAEDDGPWRIIAFIAVTIASDTGGYAAGVLAGKHPMAPSISPKKSWEGFAGSMTAGVLVGVLVVTLGLEGDWWAGALLGVVGVLAATLGDLSESLIKRDLGIKDMSDLLPGHGGLMDRLDSLIVVAPMAWLVLHYLVPVA